MKMPVERSVFPVNVPDTSDPVAGADSTGMTP
jgi:hypothetical protein